MVPKSKFCLLSTVSVANGSQAMYVPSFPAIPMSFFNLATKREVYDSPALGDD